MDRSARCFLIGSLAQPEQKLGVSWLKRLKKGWWGHIATAISKAESIERYEKRAISRKKKIVRRMLVTE